MLITMKNNVGARYFVNSNRCLVHVRQMFGARSAQHCRVMKQTPDFCLEIFRNICLSISGE